MFKVKTIFVLLALLDTKLVGINLAYAEDTSSSSVKLSDETGFFAKEKWGVNYLNYMNGPSFTESSGSSINHFLTLKRKFNPDWSLSLTIRPDSSFGNENKSLIMSDPYLKLNYPTIYKHETGVKISGDLIYYIPVSENSKTEKLAGIISPRVNASYEIGKFNFLYLLIPKAYVNKVAKDDQKIYSHSHYLATGYKLSNLVTLDFALYPAWTIKRNQTTEFNDLPAMPGMTFNFNKEVSLSPYLEVSLLKPSNKSSSIGAVFNYTLL